MLGKTQGEIVRTLFIPSEEKPKAPDPRIEILVGMVFDLLMEVEALREASLASSGAERGKDSAYGRAYWSTAYLTHNSCGPSSGLDKLLARFYPQEVEQGKRDWAERRTWRECSMLFRLGFSKEEIQKYMEEAREAEAFT